jgi:hypothetical protein
MKKVGFFKAFVIVALMGLATSSYAKSDVEIRDILFGNYSEYYNYSKSKIVDIYSFNFYDWVGKSYARKHDIDENKMLDRARKGAKDFSTGYSGSYLPVVFGKKYNPHDYFIIVDHYSVKFMENDYKYSTIVSGNLIIFKK